MSAQPFHSSKIFEGFPLAGLRFSEVVSFTFSYLDIAIIVLKGLLEF